MDNSSTQQQQPQLQQQQQQQQQQQPQQQPQPSRNTKNLSIKEFFTTRLMRTRSFEGGAGSPKDEATNWFDEFKARMIRKSQLKQSVTNTASNAVEEISDDPVDLSETLVKIPAIPKPKRRSNKNDDSNPSVVKESCDTKYNILGQNEEVDEAHNITESTSHDNSNPLLTTHSSASSLRARRVPQMSCVESLDFDTASINTIINRRDSRYDKLAAKRHRVLISRISSLARQFVIYLLPFNYNLPWKLLAFINFAFAVIVTALVSGNNKIGSGNLSFFYGFISGLIAASCCFLILTVSFLLHILPKPKKSGLENDSTILDSTVESNFNSTKCSSFDGKIGSELLKPFDTPEAKSDDFSLIEVLEEQSDELDQDPSNRLESLLDDDDYKGWMIEFIGDYEQRNKSDFKLKLIFVKLENRILYLCKPKNSDAESAIFPVFVQQRVYDLTVMKKITVNLLLPQNVRNRQKWVWSKKYPIKVEFQDENNQGSKLLEPTKTVQLTLFAKSCREKEEWFRRFKRIVDEIRLAQGQLAHKRASLQSDLSYCNDYGLIDSTKDSRCHSPSSTASESVQTSQSSHLLNDSVRYGTDTEERLENYSSNLVRTKSCEIFHSVKEAISTDHDQPTNDLTKLMADDDSTLTRETAELFSQAVEYSNFLESRPNLCYRDYIERVIESSKDATSTSDWFNSLTGRIFFDVFSHKHWSIWFKRKIQRKLHRIRLPYFMETLTLSTIDLGTEAPQFLNVVSHNFDSFGLSVDFDMNYNGGLTMTFETKLNLLKIKSDNANQSVNSVNSGGSIQNPTLPQTSDTNDTSQQAEHRYENPLKEVNKLSSSSSGSAKTSGESSDSEEIDSDSSSEDASDGADEISDWEDYGAEKTRQNIVRFVDKIASSRYFQHATENRYIKKKLIDISNCPLVLTVQIQSLNGVLTLNIPPPQTDRIWYGFKPNPELLLKAIPRMGDREVNLSHVTDWIEKKLAEEFRKILVIPNMEDFVLPILKSDHLFHVTTTR